MLLVALKSRCTMYLIWSHARRGVLPPRRPLLTRGAIKEKSPVRSSEDQSSGLWLTII
jgi:hypothetical protein